MLESEYINKIDISHRKKFAQFFTPEYISDFMAEWVMSGVKKESVLEPAFGLGVFSRSILNIHPNVKITAYEIDDKIIGEAHNNIIQAGIKNINLIKDDYIKTPWGRKYDGIICNPPYLKFHDYDNNGLIPIVNENLGVNLSRLTNIYSLFLMKSLHQLKVNGRCAYIIPSEFLNSDYGVAVKDYLISLKIQLHFIIIDFGQSVFDGALTTACILLCQNNQSDGFVRFSYINKIDELKKSLFAPILIKENALDPHVKWKKYYSLTYSSSYKNLVNFSNYGKVSRGIATGDNKYFTLNEEKISTTGLPDSALLKCICHSTDIDKSVFSISDYEELRKQNKFVYLFKGEGNESVDSVKEYINYGVENGASQRFLCNNRNPWYSIEKRAPAPIWVSVFNRKGLKFIRNEAGVYNLTTFHCIYVKSDTVDIDVFYAYLLTDMAYKIFLDNSRQYGNGLVKFEPNDINKAKIVDFNQLSNENVDEIKRLFSLYKKSENIEFISEIEKVFLQVCS